MIQDLYSSLAAQQSLDSHHKDQVLELAAFSRLLSSIPDSSMSNVDSAPQATTPACADLATTWATLTKPIFTAADPANISFVNAPRNVTSVAFDSPLDHSLASPASTRDFQESPFQDFDLSANMDAPLFPDHGTQQSQSDNLLAGLPLFGAEFAWSQQLNINNETSPSQNTIVPTTTSTGNDFSFDALAMSNDFVSPVEPSQEQHQVSPADIRQLAANFVREYARSHDVRDIDVLLSALRVAGIDVSIQDVAEALASASARSPSPQAPSPAAVHSLSPSVSPLNLPSNAVPRAASHSHSHSSHGKHRSSVHTSPKDPFTVDKTQKRFTCPECHKPFDRAFNLRTHMITHVDTDDRDKPYMCPWSECAKPFSRKYDAERHYRTVHVKKGEIATKKQVEMALSGQYGIPAPSSSSSSLSRSSSSIDLANG